MCAHKMRTFQRQNFQALIAETSRRCASARAKDLLEIDDKLPTFRINVRIGEVFWLIQAQLFSLLPQLLNQICGRTMLIDILHPHRGESRRNVGEPSVSDLVERTSIGRTSSPWADLSGATLKGGPRRGTSKGAPPRWRTFVGRSSPGHTSPGADLIGAHLSTATSTGRTSPGEPQQGGPSWCGPPRGGPRGADLCGADLNRAVPQRGGPWDSLTGADLTRRSSARRSSAGCISAGRTSKGRTSGPREADLIRAHLVGRRLTIRPNLMTNGDWFGKSSIKGRGRTWQWETSAVQTLDGVDLSGADLSGANLTGQT